MIRWPRNIRNLGGDLFFKIFGISEANVHQAFIRSKQAEQQQKWAESFCSKHRRREKYERLNLISIETSLDVGGEVNMVSFEESEG